MRLITRSHVGQSCNAVSNQSFNDVTFGVLEELHQEFDTSG